MLAQRRGRRDDCTRRSFSASRVGGARPLRGARLGTRLAASRVAPPDTAATATSIASSNEVDARTTDRREPDARVPARRALKVAVERETPIGPARRPLALRRRAASSSRAARAALVALARALAVATLVGLAVADPRASSPSSSPSSAVRAPPAASSDERLYEVRADAPTPRAVSGTTRRPGALKLIGHSRLALHRAFHHLVLEVRDDGGFLANNCKLSVSHPPIPPPRRPRPPRRRRRRLPRRPRARAQAETQKPPVENPRGGHRRLRPRPARDVAIFGPLDRDVVIIPECDRRAASIPVAYRASLRSSNAADGGRRARLFLGIALVALAPR